MNDDTYQFYFSKNGEGKTEYNSTIKKYTIGGLVLKPGNDADNNYGVVVLDGETPVDFTVKYDESFIDDDAYVLVNKQGTIVKNKTVKDENDQYWRTDSKGHIKNMAADKDEYDYLKKIKGWS